MATPEGNTFGPGLPENTTYIRPITKFNRILTQVMPITSTDVSAIGNLLFSQDRARRVIVGFIPCDEEGKPLALQSPSTDTLVVPRVYIDMDLAGTPAGMEADQHQLVSRKRYSDRGRDFLVRLGIDTVAFNPRYEAAADSPFRKSITQSY